MYGLTWDFASLVSDRAFMLHLLAPTDWLS